MILVLEVVLRLGLFVWHDFSQYYLFYGFHNLVGRVGVSPWSVYSGDHFKFPPNYVLQGAAGQGTETASTNSLGFRGPDFEPAKTPDTFRVLTLGGSSTFGFHNADDETYPFYLQSEFLDEERDIQVEVINAGFPYYTSASIRSLLEDELFEYDPDLLTLYTAYNDASWPLQLGAGTRLVFWLQQHSTIYLVAKETVLTDQRIYKIQKKLRRRLQEGFDPGALEDMAEQVAARYRQNLEAILSMAMDHGVPTVLIRQPMTTRQQNKGIGELTYEQEYEAVVEKLEKREYTSTFDIRMILHHRLIEELDAIAKEHDLPIVDNIALLDQNPSGLTTWVHLTADANERLAAEIHSALLPVMGLESEPSDSESSDSTPALD